MTDKIINVQALHNHHDAILHLVVQTAEQCVRIPLYGTFPFSLRVGVLRFRRIVNDDEIAAAAGERPTNGRRKAVAAKRGGKLQLGVLGGTDARGKDSLIKIRSN